MGMGIIRRDRAEPAHREGSSRTMEPTVILKKSIKSRYQGVYEALQLLKGHENLEKGIRDQQVLVKPNLVSATRQLAATHVDAVRAVLEAVIELGPKRIIIGEASAENTNRAYDNFDYRALEKEYNVELMDLNKDDYEEAIIYDGDGRRDTVRLAKTVLQSGCRISVAKPKTHDTVIITGSFKNMIVGSIIGEDKIKIHQGYPAINLNIALLGRLIAPHLGVIDGFEGMEGDGPVGGDRVFHRIALASTDSIALDAVIADLMGFQPEEIGYLTYAKRLGIGEMDLDRIRLEGDYEDLSEVRKRYRPHRSYKSQKGWAIEGTKLKEILDQLCPC